jgi:hypothetical protein
MENIMRDAVPSHIHPADILQAQMSMFLRYYKQLADPYRIGLIHEGAVKHANQQMGLNWNGRRLPNFESDDDRSMWMYKWISFYLKDFEYYLLPTDK